jgi:shikimate kinase
MNLYLIGLPGSGKTTLGEKLAKLLTLDLVDTDAEIVREEGVTIETIFKTRGEEYFRKKEQTLLHRISQNDGQLISTGGGMPCFFDNIEYMNQHGISVFIDVPPEVIQQRLITQRHQNRPMLENKTDEQVLTFLQQKYQERLPFYSKASLTIRGINITAEEILIELKNKK